MARTHSTFDETYPAGTLQANQLDDIVRRTRLEVKELLEQGVYADCDVDPVVLKAEVSGLKTSKVITIHRAAFNEVSSSYAAPVILPPGVTVRKVEFILGTTGGVARTISFEKIAFSTALTNTVIWSSAVTPATTTLYDSGAISDVIGSDALYFLEATGTTGIIYGARITYDTTSHLITI